jgi:hypothetical protein
MARLGVSIIGLIRIPTEALYLVVELAGLIVVLTSSLSAVVIVPAWSEFAARSDRPKGRRGDWSEAGPS